MQILESGKLETQSCFHNLLKLEFDSDNGKSFLKTKDDFKLIKPLSLLHQTKYQPWQGSSQRTTAVTFDVIVTVIIAIISAGWGIS